MPCVDFGGPPTFPVGIAFAHFDQTGVTMASDGIHEESKIGDERLNEQVADIINGHVRDVVAHDCEIVSLESTATVADAVAAMIENRVGVVLIVEDDRIMGLFSERDVLTRVVSASLPPAETPVSSVMTPHPHSLTIDAEIVFALNRMAVGGFRHIPIVDGDDRPVAMLSMRDIVRHIVSFFPSEVFNLPESHHGNISKQREGA
jgi:CBS domain-containing protein